MSWNLEPPPRLPVGAAAAGRRPVAGLGPGAAVRGAARDEGRAAGDEGRTAGGEGPAGAAAGRLGAAGAMAGAPVADASGWAGVGLIEPVVWPCSASNRRAARCCCSLNSMLVPQRQQSATINHSRTVIGAPQSGQAHMSTSPLSQRPLAEPAGPSPPTGRLAAGAAPAAGSATAGSGPWDAMSTTGSSAVAGRARAAVRPGRRSTGTHWKSTAESESELPAICVSITPSCFPTTTTSPAPLRPANLPPGTGQPTGCALLYRFSPALGTRNQGCHLPGCRR